MSSVSGAHIYDGVLFSGGFPAEHLDRVKTMQFYDTDVLIAGYPKSGNTWMQELTYLIMTDGDFQAAKRSSIIQRSPQLELKFADYDGLEVAKSIKRPRLLKTHLYYRMFEETFKQQKPKVIVIMRNLKDTLTSYYHFCRALPIHNFHGNFGDYLELFEKDQLVYGNWFDFNLGWWEQKDDPNFLFITYEEMIKDIYSVIAKLCNFLNKQLPSDIIEAIVKHTSFKEMKSNKMVNWEFFPEALDQRISQFIRKGEIGDWQNCFTVRQNRFIDNLLQEKLAGTQLHFEERM